MPSLLLLKLIGVAVLIGGVFLAGYNTAHKFDQAALAKANAEAQAKYVAKDQAYNQIANDYEKAKANNAQTIVTRNRIVTRVVQAPVYRNVCFDARGLRIVNSALTRTTPDTSELDTTLPAVDTAK